MRIWILYLFVLDISCEIILKVNEESLKNTEVDNIKKYLDSKYLNNQQLSYLTDGLLITIEPSGKMVLRRQIDLEKLCKLDKLCCGNRVCRIPHSVIVNRRNKFLTEIRYKLEIIDINDQQPKFNQKSLSFQIKESAQINTTFSLELARDLDFSTENNLIKYELIDNTRTFVIDNPNPGQLMLRLVKPLDYEVKRYYTAKLNACDKDYCTEQAIMVNVIDVNDNKPIFNRKQYKLFVNENRPTGSIICQVNATDKDSEERGLISYQFGIATDRDVRNTFTVNRHTGKITLIKSLSKGDRKIYSFTVTAQDGGAQIFKDTTHIVITVKDINNNAPLITVISSVKNHMGRIEILENYNTNYSLCTIKVVDLDSGNNSKVDCNLKANIDSNKFRLVKLKETFYALRPKKKFDYETKALYSVDMVCRDFGVPMKTSSRLFLIHIKDVNEFDPVFLNTSYQIHVPENTDLNTKVLNVKAEDRDGSAFLTYKLEQKAKRYFKINEMTGQIRTHNEKLDREKVQNVIFNVYVTDATVDPRSATAKVIILVDDQNDNIPAFGLIPKFTIRENQVSTTLDGRLTATDKDTGKNGNVTFSLFKTWAKQQELPSIFYVTSQGQIQTLQSLDRETFSEFTLLVGVKDQGKKALAALANVTVTVLDENDNKPQWLIPTPLEPVINISHSAKIVPGDVILTLRAFDPDDGDNGRVSYFLEQQGRIISSSSPSSSLVSSTLSPSEQNTDPFFQVDEITGELKLVRGKIPKYSYHPNPNVRNSLDQPNLSVMLVARDNGKPKSRSSNLRVAIFQHTLIDETLNDNLLQPNATVIIILIASVGFILTALVVSIICIRKRPLTTDINHPSNAIYSAKYSSCPAPVNINNSMYNNGSRLLNGSQLIHSGKQQYSDAEWNFQDVNNIIYGNGLDQTGANSMIGKEHANQIQPTDDKVQQPQDVLSRSANNSQLSTVQMRMMATPQISQQPMSHHQQLPPLHHITSSRNSYEPIDAEESGDSGKGPSEDTRNIPYFDNSFFRSYAPTLHWKIPSPIPSSGLINSNRILFPTTTTSSQLTNQLLPSSSVAMTHGPTSTLPLHFPNAPLDLQNPPPGFSLPRSPDYYTPGPGNSTKHSSQVYDSPDLFENGQSDIFENRTPDVIELAQIQQSNI